MVCINVTIFNDDIGGELNEDFMVTSDGPVGVEINDTDVFTLVVTLVTIMDG